MRKIIVSLTAVTVVIVVFGSALVQKSSAGESRANGKGNLTIQEPGSRCTRLTYGPREKKKKGVTAPTATTTGMAMPGTRCLRLSSGGRPGTMLPNTAPKVGLSTSTSYLGPDAGAEVRLRAIVCDQENDNVLYTYSTTAGRIEGDGPEAVWNLSGASRPGKYIVMVEVDDGCGCLSFTGAEVTVGS